ncbi:hypothetical protein BN1723_010485 [Verticillium longisporum]|uniref:Band 7 domain-containing protein n=1 Tax=Verticillium longisporum TaxID=100787 RepID=A0A0G4KYI5_VERLO|nr:hypothetical protein BN1723_010485 [Verticillium longisporum]
MSNPIHHRPSSIAVSERNLVDTPASTTQSYPSSVANTNMSAPAYEQQGTSSGKAPVAEPTGQDFFNNNNLGAEDERPRPTNGATSSDAGGINGGFQPTHKMTVKPPAKEDLQRSYATVAAFGISNVRQALIERTQTTLRHVIGARILQDVIERREEIAQSIGEIIEDVAAGWGVQVESMLIKDIIFSQELQESLSMAAQSKRIGESKIIAAKAEVEAAKLMRQAADILSSAPAMQIRYLEAMQAMAKSANSKVIFLPGASQGMPSLNNAHITDGNGESSNKNDITGSDFGGGNPGFQQALNSRVIENL